MEYTVVIRTLGKAGDKYQKLLDSIARQTIKPSAINVYIAEGYAIPQETIGVERYIYVKKGMVAQRALPFDDIETKYILFLDDDLYLPEDIVERLYTALINKNADVVAPDIFPNSERPFLNRVLMTLSARMFAREDDGRWAYKVMRNGGYSYNKRPSQDIYLSQTNAGACFLCKKNDMLKIQFQDELWLDNMSYAMGDDEVMFYKMYLNGLKILTFFNTGIQHLDAGLTLSSKEKDKTRIFCDFRFKTIFWHRFLYLPEKSLLSKLWTIICIVYTFMFSLFISLIKGQFDIYKTKKNAIQNGIQFICSKEYESLPLIKKRIKR